MIRLLPILIMSLAGCATAPVEEAFAPAAATVASVAYERGAYFIVDEDAAVPGGVQ